MLRDWSRPWRLDRLFWPDYDFGGLVRAHVRLHTEDSGTGRRGYAAAKVIHRRLMMRLAGDAKFRDMVTDIQRYIQDIEREITERTAPRFGLNLALDYDTEESDNFEFTNDDTGDMSYSIDGEDHNETLTGVEAPGYEAPGGRDAK